MKGMYVTMNDGKLFQVISELVVPNNGYDYFLMVGTDKKPRKCSNFDNISKIEFEADVMAQIKP